MTHARPTAFPTLAVSLLAVRLPAASLFGASLLAASLLAGCVAPPLYVGPPRALAASRRPTSAGPGYSGLISHGVVRRSARRDVTTGSEVPRDALGNPVLPDAGQAAGQAAAAKSPRHRRKHWFGL